MKRLLVVGAACVLLCVTGFSVYIWIQIRNEDRRVLRVTDIEGNTTEIHQPLITRYVSGKCSINACPVEDVGGFRIQEGPGQPPADILWGRLASIALIAPESVGDRAHPDPRAVFTFRDGKTQDATVSSYELRGETEVATYWISIRDLKAIIVSEGDELERPRDGANSVDNLQITEGNGRSQTWSGSSETAYPTVVNNTTYDAPASDTRGGIRLWRGKASFEIEWARIKEAIVNSGKDSQGQPILRIRCVFTNGQTADFTVDPVPGPRIRDQVPGTDKYNEVKLADISRIVVNTKR